jgi:hypothetical protein
VWTTTVEPSEPGCPPGDQHLADGTAGVGEAVDVAQVVVPGRREQRAADRDPPAATGVVVVTTVPSANGQPWDIEDVTGTDDGSVADGGENAFDGFGGLRIRVLDATNAPEVPPGHRPTSPPGPSRRCSSVSSS